MPANLKLLNGRGPGVDSGGRKVKLPPAFVRSAPEPPSVVLDNAEALAEWERIVPELERLELLKSIDGSALTGYVLCWSRLVDAQRDIDEHGITMIGEKGSRVRNPACGVADSATRELRQWCGMFGLSPSAESNISVPEVESGDDHGFD